MESYFSSERLLGQGRVGEAGDGVLSWASPEVSQRLVLVGRVLGSSGDCPAAVRLF